MVCAAFTTLDKVLFAETISKPEVFWGRIPSSHLDLESLTILQRLIPPTNTSVLPFRAGDTTPSDIERTSNAVQVFKNHDAKNGRVGQVRPCRHVTTTRNRRCGCRRPSRSALPGRPPANEAPGHRHTRHLSLVFPFRSSASLCHARFPNPLYGKCSRSSGDLCGRTRF